MFVNYTIQKPSVMFMLHFFFYIYVILKCLKCIFLAYILF